MFVAQLARLPFEETKLDRFFIVLVFFNGWSIRTGFCSVLEGIKIKYKEAVNTYFLQGY